ncbi:nucleoside phosphorylase [bacterium]|nr:nucleoside phosphorylase [bacterium]
MSFPNYTDKIIHPALVTPDAYWKYYQRKYLKSDVPAPKNLIVCYQPVLFNYVQKKLPLRPFFSHAYFVEGTAGNIGVFHSGGIGAPDIVSNLELLIAAGVRNIVTVGSAGSLQAALPVGGFFAGENAIRDEGTSHHYLESKKMVAASSELTQLLRDTAGKDPEEIPVGTVWTTDAPFRETRNEIEQYQSENVLGVDMEAAAVFALAEYRQVSAAALFCISDVLVIEKWVPCFHFKVVKRGLTQLFDISFEALKTLSD